jgi:hypothetical protein
MKPWRSDWMALPVAALVILCFRVAADETLFWRFKTTGDNAAWIYSGNTVTKAAIPNDIGLEWQMVGAGDFNRDGRQDILWRHSGTGVAAIWYMNGFSRIGTNAISLPNSDPLWRIQAVGDFNGDGYPDLLWRHTTLGLNAVWYLQNALVVSTTWIQPLGATAADLAWEPANSTATAVPTSCCATAHKN